MFSLEELGIDSPDENLQPFITIATQGRVANGKSSVIRALTGVNPMRYSKEAEKNMTIKLGYTNAKFYKCPNCPTPKCYQVNRTFCLECKSPMELKLHVSFVDSPGHNELQTTALSGASNMDFCLLVVSADCDQDLETNEHYKAIKILGLKSKTIVLQNKIDVVEKDVAIENWSKLKAKFDVKYILPICAQFGYGINNLIQFIVESIESPVSVPTSVSPTPTPTPTQNEFYKKISQPLKVSIIRSFDVNKPNVPVKNLCGAVVGGTIKRGFLRVGDKVRIIPGVVLANGQNHPITACITSLKTDGTNLTVGFPGGLLGIGLSVDPTLSKEDRMVGNFIVSIDDTNNKIFKTCTIVFTNYNSKHNIRQNEKCVCMLGSMTRNVKVNWINEKTKQINISSMIPMAGELDDSIIITKSNHIEMYGKILSID